MYARMMALTGAYFRCSFNFLSNLLSNACDLGDYSWISHFTQPNKLRHIRKHLARWPKSTTRLSWRISLLCCTFLSYAGYLILSYASQFLFSASLLFYTDEFVPYAAHFSYTLHISRLCSRVSLLHCRFLSYTADFSPTLADFSPRLAKFLFSARIYLAEQRNS